MNNMEGVGLSQYAAGGGILAEEAGLLNKSSARSRESPPSAAVQPPQALSSLCFSVIQLNKAAFWSGLQTHRQECISGMGRGTEQVRSTYHIATLALLHSIFLPSCFLLNGRGVANRGGASDELTVQLQRRQDQVKRRRANANQAAA